MATSGNIQTLFKNREQTEAIFPRTKVRAVTDDDGNRLDVILEDVVHIGDKVIDTSSIPINADSLGGIPAEDYATEAWVKNEIANVQAGEDVDLSGFASQDDITLLNRRIDELDYPVDSVNGKTGAVVLNAEDVGARPNTWMPTASQVGARPNTWLPTIAQIGALPAGGGNMTGAINMGGNAINNLPVEPPNDYSAVCKSYADMCFLPRGKFIDVSDISILDGSLENGGYRFNTGVTLGGKEITHMLNFNTIISNNGTCGVQIGFCYSHSDYFVIRWKWYNNWSAWKVM